MWYYVLMVGLVYIVYKLYQNFGTIIIICKYLQARYSSVKVPESTIFYEGEGKGLKIIRIYYNYKGCIYSLLLPLHNVTYNFIGTKHYLIRNREIIDLNEENIKIDEIDISQQPGIEYYVNANMLGADKILAKKFDLTKEYTGENFPQISKK